MTTISLDDFLDGGILKEESFRKQVADIDWSQYKKHIVTSTSKDSKISHDDPDDDPADTDDTTDDVVDDISGDVYMIQNCLLSIRSNIKCVVKNIHIDIDKHLSAHIYTLVIECSLNCLDKFS